MTQAGGVSGSGSSLGGCGWGFCPSKLVGLGDGLGEEEAVLDAEAGGEAGEAEGGLGEAVISEGFDVRVGDVGEGLGGGAGVGSGHVGHAVVDDALFGEDGVVVSGGAGRLGAAALVDGDIDQHAAGAHAFEQGTADEFRRASAGHEDGPDEEIDGGEQVFEEGLAGEEGVGGVEGDIEEAHAFDIDLEDGDIGAEARGHAGGVHAGYAAAENDYAAGQNAGHAAEQSAGAAPVFGEEVAADEHGHAAGDFAHGFEEGEAAFDLDVFIGEGGAAGGEEGGGEIPVGGEVEVGEEKLAGAEERVFGGEGFFDLHDEVGLGKDGFVGGEEVGPGAFVVGIGIAGACARAALDEDGVALFDELKSGGGE